ncbi:ABC transporter transmembrane domain-containing protein [Arthrobacter sp. Hor0625]|uniref:ABC transporter transmembrane domain-containing protein n=1 Tax=Arthrobacter sp. Hor0625 TaxID=3457358 RepID=UPI00403E9A56
MTFWRFRRALKPRAVALAAGAALVVLAAALQVALPWPLKIIVDDVLKSPGGASQNEFLRAIGAAGLEPQQLLWVAIAGLLALTVANAAAHYFGARLLNGVGERVMASIRSEVFTHLQRLSLSFHDKQRLGDLVTRATTDIDYVRAMIISMLAVLVPNVLILAFITTICIVVDPGFALIALAVSPVLFATVLLYRPRIKAASRAARKKDSDIASTMTETFSSVRVMQSSSSEARHEADFQDRNAARMTAGLRLVRLQAALSPLVDVIVTLGTVVVLWAGVQRVLDGSMTLGLLLVFLAYLKALYDPMKELSKLTTVMSRGQVSAERLQDVLNTAPAITDPPGTPPAPLLAGAVELRDVDFHYDDAEVLHKINLRVEPGRMIALTGPTGAGKSTVVSLIPRLYDVTGGAVLLDGMDVRDLQLATVRRQISMVLQESILFHGTIYDNIAYGSDAATPEQVFAAAHAAHVDEFVDRLPLGYDTPVAERGVSLSGGQRQRIAIARALVRDTPIVILDEPTSGLDAISEQYVMEGMDRLMAGRTVIVIAHRLSTLRRADRIYVLDKGRIVESGDHSQLLAAGGLYSRLDGLQGTPGKPVLPPAVPGVIRETTTAMPRTSGALPWRVGRDGALEVLLVHRRNHQDWSIPKGKAEPGETDQECALREVGEETGLVCRAGSELPQVTYLDRRRRLKTVRYWAAEAQGGTFSANAEVDDARWFSLPAALRTLSEPRERPVILALGVVLERELGVRAAPARDRMLLLVRGASATPRHLWDHSEITRPLAHEGHTTARSLEGLGSFFEIDRVLSAPAARCIDTVGPLARRASLSVEVAGDLSDGRIDRAMGLVDNARGTGTVLCTHEDVISSVLDRLAARDGTALDSRAGRRRGSVWALTGDASRYTCAYYLPMPQAVPLTGQCASIN